MAGTLSPKAACRGSLAEAAGTRPEPADAFASSRPDAEKTPGPPVGDAAPSLEEGAPASPDLRRESGVLPSGAYAMIDHGSDDPSADEAHREDAVGKRPRAGEPSAVSPKDAATGAVTPRAGPMDRPGTEADEAGREAGGGLPGPGPGRDGELAAAYRENDA